MAREISVNTAHVMYPTDIPLKSSPLSVRVPMGPGEAERAGCFLAAFQQD